MAIFQDNPDKPVPEYLHSRRYWSEGWWRWWWQLELQDAQSSSQIVTTNKINIQHVTGRMDAFPVAQPTAVNVVKGKSITFHGLAYQRSPASIPNLSLILKCYCLPRGRLQLQASCQPSHTRTPKRMQSNTCMF